MAPIVNVEDDNANSVTVKVVKSPSCIKIKSNYLGFIARVSTGNAYSTFSQKVLNDMKLDLDEEKDELVEVTLGPPLKSIGRKTLTIKIGNVLVTHKFFVVKSLAEDFLIGGDIIFGKFGGISLSQRFWTERITLGSD